MLLNTAVILFVCLLGVVLAKNPYVLKPGSQCKIPNFDVFSEELKNIYQKDNYIPCTNQTLLTYTEVDLEENFVKLKINQTALEEYTEANEELKCCLRYVTREGIPNFPDVGIRLSSCSWITTETILTKETVSVHCYVNNTFIYSNVHNPIFPKKHLIEKTKDDIIDNKPISVIFVVIDSVSRLNLIRTMPETYKWLIENNFFEMKGYNKIDDNTFPNFNALLTGFNLRESNRVCQPNKLGMLDKCPMIWYDYRNLGYVTAYAEDHTVISTYNYLKKGFTKEPTDYYFKPYFEASEFLGTSIQDYMPFCAGPESAGERVLNLAKDFAFAYKDVPKFGIFWMNTFSHNHINAPTRMDEKHLEFFKDLKVNGVLEDNVIVFLSDHGIRFGEIRQTTTGFFEERLPMNFISLPTWFKQKYPEETSNLDHNQHKLTTTFDLYQTLQHLLALSGKNYTETPCQGAPKCTSLLKPISSTRSCQEAGVPEQWCTCFGHVTQIQNDSSIVINKALIYIDKHLKDKYSGNYTLSLVKKATLSENLNNKEYLLVQTQTEPYGLFNSLFRHNVLYGDLRLIQVIKIA